LSDRTNLLLSWTKRQFREIQDNSPRPRRKIRPHAVETDVFVVSRGLTPDVTHFSGAARAARCLEQCIPNISPDTLLCSATKVSANGLMPPAHHDCNRRSDNSPRARNILFRRSPPSFELLSTDPSKLFSESDILAWFKKEATVIAGMVSEEASHNHSRPF